MKLVSKSVADTRAFAEKIFKSLTPGASARVLALYGDLGSGKTTFVQSLGKFLGVTHSMQSPTFVLMKRYELNHSSFKNFIHIDAYRLEKPDELARLDFERFLSDPANIIAVEWAERVETLLPQDTTRIYFKFVDETTREIEMLE